MNLLTKLIDRDGFSLGEPWRLNEKSLIVVVPILKGRPWGQRSYITAEEAKKDLELNDTGKIDMLGILNKSGKPVFLRVGTIFEGVGTQSRGAEYSTVLDAERLKVEVAVRCVHASHPITTNAIFHLSSSSSPVDSSFLHHRGQMDTWASVQSSTARYSSMRQSTFQRSSSSSSAHLNRHLMSPNYGAVHSDNLVASLNEVPLSIPSTGAVSAAAKDIADLISKIPVDMTSQVGVCVIDLDGVREFEAFDHPDSWTAVAKSIARKYAPEFDTPGKLVFDVKRENIEAAVTEFLVKVDKSGMALHHRKSDGRSAVWVANSDEAVGEYVELDNSGIHVILTRKQKPEAERSRPDALVRYRLDSTFAPRIETRSSFPPLIDTTVTAYGGNWTTSSFENRKHHLFVTRSLMPDRDVSWGDVQRRIRSEEGHSVSPTTISHTLNAGVRDGFIRKSSPPGKRKSFYRLTAKGSTLLHKAR